MVIRDVIHGDINIEEKIIVDLIETREFQRLKSIKQLGLSYMVFPTTEHSRYMHSIGTYHLGCIMISNLIKKENVNFNSKDIQALKIACLLHDLGHGAFSHTSEEFFQFHHEEYSVEMIINKETQINQILMRYDPEIIGVIVDFIEKNHKDQVLNSILSGTIDVDRMDYLMRDSYFAGVSYGEIDVDRILNVVDVKENKLVFLEKGIKTIEDLILSRYNMFMQVYLNKKAIAYEVLVKEILTRVRILKDAGYSFMTNLEKVIPFLENDISIIDYIKLDDSVLITMINDFSFNEKDKILKELSTAFVAKKIRFNKPDNFEYQFKTYLYDKKIYNESVLIYTKAGEIKPLEELSQITSFIKENLKINLDEIDFYIIKEDNE